jgi:hypothetical protein
MEYSINNKSLHKLRHVVLEVIKHSLKPQNGHGFYQVVSQALQHTVYPQYGNYNFENRDNGEKLSEHHSVYRVSYSPIIILNKHNKHHRNHRQYDLNQTQDQLCDPYSGSNGNYYSNEEFHE